MATRNPNDANLQNTDEEGVGTAGSEESGGVLGSFGQNEEATAEQQAENTGSTTENQSQT